MGDEIIVPRKKGSRYFKTRGTGGGGGNQSVDEAAPLPVEIMGADITGRVVEVMTSTQAQILDALERIQQQLAKMNEGENLVEGDRHYG